MPRPNRGSFLSDEPNEHGYFEIRWTHEGRSHRKSTGTADRGFAQRIFANHILGGDEEGEDGCTVAEVLAAYRKGILSTIMGLPMFNSNEGHLLAYFGHMGFSALTPQDCQDYVDARAAGQVSWRDEAGRLRGGRKSKPGSTRRELSMLVAAGNYLVRTKKLAARDLPYIPLPEQCEARDLWLTREQAVQLLDACQPDKSARLTRVFRFTACALYTGSRREVVESLPWPRVSFTSDWIDFQKPGRRRTKKRRGKVPMSDELRAIMQRAYDERINEWFLDKPTTCYDEVIKVAASIGLDWVTPHVLRHTWATWAAQDGVSLYEIAGVLHDTITTVERVYAHHCPSHLRGAVNRGILGQGRKDMAA